MCVGCGLSARMGRQLGLVLVTGSFVAVTIVSGV